MSNFGGPNSAFEKNWERKFRPLKRRLTRLENRLFAWLRTPLTVPSKTLRTKGYWQAFNVEINKIYREMERVYSTWNVRELPLVYRQSLATIQRRIENTKSIANTAKKSITEMINSRETSAISKTLVADSNTSYRRALTKGRRNVARLTRETQQILVDEVLIDNTIAAAFDAGNVRVAVEILDDRLSDAAKEMYENKRFVQAGRYKYKPSYYAEMVTRTKFHDAQSTAALAQCGNYDTDLVQVSSHNTTTVICMEFEGKVYSISGKDKRFPPLTDSSPFHPNCLHLMFPTFESGMEAQGSLESFSAFSRDKISRPPAPASFVPVADRTA